VYFWLGSFLESTVEGIEPTQVPKLLPLTAVAALISSIVLSVRWALGIGAARSAEQPELSGMGRRRFLAGGAVIVGGVAASAAALVTRLLPWWTVTVQPIVAPQVEKTAPNPRSEWKEARISAYRRLGRTGFEVSDISLGSGQITNGTNGEAIARAAIERGVNYFDTAPDYSGFGSELVLGKAMKGHRDKMFLATKFCTGDGHLDAGTPVYDYINVVEASLRRLQTDYVDLVHIHSCNTVARLMDPNVHEAFGILKQQGKVRFLGFSSHTPNLVQVANTAIESGLFDVMMLAYHHGSWPQLGDVIDRAAAADVGVVAMKTLKGAKHRGMEEFRGDADAYSQAAFKWVLSNPSVACLVVSFFKQQHVDEYLYASGGQVDASDHALLERYDRAIAGQHCLPHCGSCLGSCPEQLAIDDVFRHRMYFEDYGREKYAMELYAKLEKQADVCVGCSAPCTGSCPQGIPIQQRAMETHELLTLV
jgi:predicted aldo/keto reductase-like oxidoreductase